MNEQRVARVRAEMQAHGLTQMIISDSKSIWYLTGASVEPYERLMALYLPVQGEPVIFLNKLFFVPQAPCREVWHTDSDKPVEQIAEVVDKTKTLGIDKEWPAKFLIPLMELCPGMPVVLASDCVDACRAVKDAEEQMLMKEASRINDETILKARDYVKPGMTEKQVAEYIDNEYKKAGCESVAFTTIVSFGANAADPHHEPDDTVLEKGECVLIDMGCCKNRYCSDMTRTFFCGEPKPEYAAIHDLVRQANEAAEAMIHPGVRLCDIDAAARDLITKAGYGEYFNHRLGHFIGQTDHEKGDVSAANTDTVKPGMIFSIEPGVYLPGKFGRSTMRVPQPDIIEHFGNADAVPQPPEQCLSRQAGIVRCCLRFMPVRGVGNAAPTTNLLVRYTFLMNNRIRPRRGRVTPPYREFTDL